MHSKYLKLWLYFLDIENPHGSKIDDRFPRSRMKISLTGSRIKSLLKIFKKLQDLYCNASLTFRASECK